MRSDLMDWITEMTARRVYDERRDRWRRTHCRSHGVVVDWHPF